MVRFIVLLGLLLWPSITSAQTISHTLTWQDNSNNEAGFKIEQALGTTGAFVEISQVGVDVTTAQGIIVDSQNRCYRVRAFNAVGNSAYSNTVCSLRPQPTPPTSLPNAPDALTLQEVITP